MVTTSYSIVPLKDSMPSRRNTLWHGGTSTLRRSTRVLCMLAVALLLPWALKAQTVYDTVPLMYNFEDTTHNGQWTFVSGSCSNIFVADTGANITVNGSRSMHVTEVESSPYTPYSYKTGSGTAGDQTEVQSRVYAYRDIYFPDSGYYDIGYWWNCYGETIYDYGRLALAPISWSFSASTTAWDSTTSVTGQYWGSTSVPSSFICLDNGHPLSGVTAPQYLSKTFHIDSAGLYRLVFLWNNDGNTGSQPPVMIDDLQIHPHSCGIPENLRAYNLTTSSFSLTWDDDNIPNSWTVLYDTCGTVNFGNTQTVTTNDISISNVTSGGVYDVMVQANCAAGEVGVPAFYRVTIPTCNPIDTLPYSYDFDNATTYGSSSVPPVIPCWIHQNMAASSTAQGYPYLSSNSTYSHNMNHALYFYYTTTNNYDKAAGVALPAINRDTIDITHVVLNFWAVKSSSTYTPRLVVGVMSDPYNRSTFEPIDTIANFNTTLTEYHVPFTSYTGIGNYISIRETSPSSGTYSYLYVSDISLTDESCPRPMPTVDSLTATEAYISWVSTSASAYEVALSESDQSNATQQTDTTYVMTNLTSNTEYTIWVRSVCDGTYGNWQSVTFRTSCAAINTYPWTEDFESSATGTGNAPFCWTFLSDGTGTYQNMYPYVSSGTYAHSPSKYAYVYLQPMTSTNTTMPYFESLILPEIDTIAHAINELRLSFYCRNSSATYNDWGKIGVMKNNYDDSTFLCLDSFYVTNTSTLYEFDLANCPEYEGYSHIAIRFARRASGYFYAYVDDVSLILTPDCPRPLDLGVQNLTQVSTDLFWSDTTDASEWSVYYGLEGFNYTDSAYITAYDTIVTLTGLTANTTYDVYVVPACDGVPEPAFYSFTTPCDFIDSLPYTQDFDSCNTSSTSIPPVVPCWVYLNDGNYFYPYLSATASYCHSGNRGWYWYHSTSALYGTFQALVLPGINTENYNMQNLTVKFWARATSTSYQPAWEVGVMTNPNDPSTFVSCQTIGLTDNTTTWTELSASLSNYTGTGNFIAIRGVSNPDGNYTYWYGNLDDVTVEWTACPTPVPTVTATTDSAYLSWEGSASGFEYEVVASDSTATGVGTYVTTNSAEVGGLTSGTAYTIYLRAICGSDTTEWSSTSFRTACGVIDQIPYSYSFEDAPAGSSTSTDFAYCWSRLTGTATYYYPYVGGSTTYAHTGNRGLYWYQSSTVGTYPAYQIVIFPELNTTNHPLDSLVMSFWTRPSSATYAPWFIGGVMTDPTNDSTFVPIDTFYVAQDINWQKFEMVFAGYSDTGRYVALKSVQTSTNWYAYVDDFSLDALPSCSHPFSLHANNVTSNSADLSWISLCGAGNFIVEYSDGTTTNTVTTTSTSTTLSNLQSNTTYTVNVRSLCSTTDTSDASIVCSFHTACSYITHNDLPWEESFESTPTTSSNSTSFAYCWQRYTNATNYYYPYVSSSTTYAHTGARGLYWYGGSTSTSLYGTYQGIVLPDVDPAIPIDTLQLSFWIRTSSATYTSRIVIGAMSDLNNDNTFVPIDTIFHSGITWTQYEVPLASYSDTGRYIVMKSYYGDGYWYAYVDDIGLDYIPSCVKVTDLTVDSTFSNGAVLSWNHDATNYILSYKTALDEEYTQVEVSDTTFTLTGLSSSTTYTWYVQAVCTPGDTSRASTESMFTTTLCAQNTIYQWDTAGTANSSYNAPVNNFYRNTLCEIIIDSAELGGALTFNTLGFKYEYATAMVNKTDVTIYIQPTDKSTFTGTTDMVQLDTATAVLVFTGSLNCSQGWNYFALAEPYNYTGQGNLMLIIDDNSNEYDGSLYKFSTRSCTGYKTITWYSDTYDPDPLDTSNFSGSKTYYTWRPEMQFVACEPDCMAPVSYVVSHSYDSATVSIDAPIYEWSLRQASEAEYGDNTVDSAEYLTFSNLLPATAYQYRVRQICDEEQYSDYLYVDFITDSLPCFVPSNFQAIDVRGLDATLSWTVGPTATSSELMVFNSTYADTLTVADTQVTISGLTAGVTYYALVRANCGNGTTYSDWSDTISFTTVICDPVTAVNATNVTGTSADINWTAGNNNTGSWEISWNYQGAGMSNLLGSATVSDNTYTISDLTPNTPYEVFVKAICGEGYTSDLATTTFTTQQVGIARVEEGLNLTLFPNPATGNTTVTLSGVNGNVTLSIIDMSGRTVRSYTMECNGDCEKHISVDNLVAGAYFVRVYGDNVNTVKKLIVK